MKFVGWTRFFDLRSEGGRYSIEFQRNMQPNSNCSEVYRSGSNDYKSNRRQVNLTPVPNDARTDGVRCSATFPVNLLTILLFSLPSLLPCHLSGLSVT